MDFDVIVIGSGFGGAITACRLAEKGLRVLILERGRWWTAKTYPRLPDDPWIWSHTRPEIYNGWTDLRRFPGMAVIAGAGVGGGSLIYANVSCVPPANDFLSGWPPEITFSDMQPYYAKVADFLDVQEVPPNQRSPRTQLMQQAAIGLGQGARFRPAPLAVSFDPDLLYDYNTPPDLAKSKRFINKHGVEQGTCAQLGECDIGCRADAKNTLDKNYIPVAIRNGAQVRDLHLVTNIEPIPGGYRVDHDELSDGKRIPGSTTAERVVVAAGSMGSTELMLRCRDVTKTLPNLTPSLGKRWSSNGDFLTPALYIHKELWPDRGTAIGSVIDYLDGSDAGQTFWIQDGAIPNVLNKYFQAVIHELKKAPSETHLMEGFTIQAIIQHITMLAGNTDVFKHIMPWFAQGVDAGDGELSLTNGDLDLKWNLGTSLPVFDAIQQKHRDLSHATGGHPFELPTWLFKHELITPHPLGGCRMSSSAADGVVSHDGEVFNYPHLYVVDGAIVPRPLGVNPSRTIGALAERIAELM